MLDDIANKFARESIDNIDEFYDESDIKKWIETQANILWRYKKKPIQEHTEKEQDYFCARSYLGYLMSDAVLTGYQCQKRCILQRYSPTHLNLIQSLSLEDYLQNKAYLNWIYRSGKKLSSIQDRFIDYKKAIIQLREAICLCNWCQCAPEKSFWKKLLASYPSDSKLFTLHNYTHSVISRIAITFSLTEYINFSDVFYKGLYSMSEGKAISWNNLKNLLCFSSLYPAVVTVFEYILIRAMLSDYMGRLYEKAVSNCILTHELIEPQAWLFWYMKDCPKQSDVEMKKDYCNAYSYLAYICIKKLLNMLLENNKISVESLSKNQLNLLQSLTLHEYLAHAAMANYMYNKEKLGYCIELNANDLKNELLKLINNMRGVSNNKDIANRNKLTRVLSGMNYRELYKDKLTRLNRLGVNNPTQLNQLKKHIEQFYKKYRAPTNILNYQYVMNMYELIVAHQ